MVNDKLHVGVYTTYLIKDPGDNAPVYVGQTENFEKGSEYYWNRNSG